MATVAIGNPGSGKSTLLNSLAGERLFKSGQSIGKGLTYELNCGVNAEGKQFYDTPGLKDVAQREQAAKAIADALRKGGDFKVLFFITQEDGRVSQEDVTTMKLVLDAAPDIGRNYGVIINKVFEGVLEMLKDDSKKNEFVDSIFHKIPKDKRCRDSNMIFFEEIEELEDEDDVLVSPDKLKDQNGMTLDQFHENKVPVISIKTKDVSDIKYKQFDEIKKELEELQKRIQKLNLQDIIGKKDFFCTRDNTPVDMEKRVSKRILKKIKKNINCFCLGNAIKTNDLKSAVELLFKRDYHNKTQIFVPNYFIGEAPFDEEKLCSKLEERANDEHFSEEEKEHWNSKLIAAKREATERIVYELLRKFYEKREDEFLVLHGYKLMEMDDDPREEDKPHIRTDFIIINKTYGYVFNIAVERTLNEVSLRLIDTNLRKTKRLLEKWFGAYIVKHWHFISAIFCNESDIIEQLSEELKDELKDYIFLGRDEFPQKLKKLHENMKKIVPEARFHWLLHTNKSTHRVCSPSKPSKFKL